MRFTRKIIGFRSGKRRNKVFASIGYIMFTLGFILSLSSGPTTRDSFVHALAWILLFLFIFIPIANIFSVRSKFFFFNRKSLFGKVLGTFGYVVMALIICMAIGTGMESATAKQLEAKQQSEQIAKAKEDANAKMKAQQEAQAKAQQEGQAKAQQEGQAKAQQEGQAKAQQEGQAKAQQEGQAKAQQEGQAKAQQEAQVKAQAQAKAEAEAQAKAQQEAQTQQTTVQILSVSNPAPRNSIATLTAKVTPGAFAYIAVHYESGDSTSPSLSPKQADSNGNVSWSWHVGGRTTIGTWPITVTCNSASADTQFTVVH